MRPISFKVRNHHRREYATDDDAEPDSDRSAKQATTMRKIPGAARSFFHHLARARSGALSKVWSPCFAQTQEDALV
jgi:hypothetical protein